MHLSPPRCVWSALARHGKHRLEKGTLQLLDVTLRVLSGCRHHDVTWSLENSLASLLCDNHKIRPLMHSHNVEVLKYDACAYMAHFTRKGAGVVIFMIVLQAPFGCRTAMVNNANPQSLLSSCAARPRSQNASWTERPGRPWSWNERRMTLSSGTRTPVADLEAGCRAASPVGRAQRRVTRRDLRDYRNTLAEQAVSMASAASDRRLAEEVTAWAQVFHLRHMALKRYLEYIFQQIPVAARAKAVSQEHMVWVKTACALKDVVALPHRPMIM